MKILGKAIAIAVLMVLSTLVSLLFTHIVKDLGNAFDVTIIQNASFLQVFGAAYIIGLFSGLPGRVQRMMKNQEIHENLLGKQEFADRMAMSFAIVIVSCIVLCMSWGLGHIIANILS